MKVGENYLNIVTQGVKQRICYEKYEIMPYEHWRNV